MAVINENLILETINMIKLYNLDIRTVTMAISLRDCMDSDVDVVCDNIYNKIKRYAKNLVEYANDLEMSIQFRLLIRGFLSPLYL